MLATQIDTNKTLGWSTRSFLLTNFSCCDVSVFQVLSEMQSLMQNKAVLTSQSFLPQLPQALRGLQMYVRVQGCSMMEDVFAAPYQYYARNVPVFVQSMQVGGKSSSWKSSDTGTYITCVVSRKESSGSSAELRDLGPSSAVVQTSRFCDFSSARRKEVSQLAGHARLSVDVPCWGNTKIFAGIKHGCWIGDV